MVKLQDSHYSLLVKILGAAVLLCTVGNYCCALVGKPAPSGEIGHEIVTALLALLIVPHKTPETTSAPS